MSVPRVKGAAWVAHEIRSRIADGELAVGDAIAPEDELMARFGMARTTVREGLRIVESDGLIEVRRGRGGGARVIAPRIDRLAEDFAVHLQLAGARLSDLDAARQLVEPPLAGRLAAVGTDEDLEALRAAVEAVAVAVAAGDAPGFGLAALRVHETIVEQAGNPVLVLLSRLLHSMLTELYAGDADAVADAQVMRRAVKSYRRFLALVEARDAVGAEDMWRTTMTHTARLFADRPLQALVSRRPANLRLSRQP